MSTVWPGLLLGGLGLYNTMQGQQAESEADRFLRKAGRLTSLQLREFRRLIDILSNPQSPERRILLDQANRGLAGRVAGARGQLVSDLASRGFESPRSLEAPLRLLEERGIAAGGEMERDLLSDFLTKRIGMVNPGQALSGALSLGNIFGERAAGYGQGLGSIIAALAKLFAPNISF